MDTIPQMDLSRQMRALDREVADVLHAVITDCAFSGGTYVETFEREFAEWLGGIRFAGVSSGTAALLLALRVLGVRQGDEVIVPANTFIATAWAPVYFGATPVFVDCDPFVWELDPASAEKKITPRTKAIIGVHLYGQTFPLRETMRLAEAYGLKLIEDCAQAHGTRYGHMRVGTFGDVGCFSFYPGKNLGACGEAGGLSTRDPGLERRVKALRNQGAEVRYRHDEVGYNMRMDGFQAAILSLKLRKIEAWNRRRKEIYERYREEIRNSLIVFQGLRPDTEPAWHLAVCCVDHRERFLAHMAERGISCGIHYPVPCHLQKAFSQLHYYEGDLPNAEYLAAHCVSLPLFPELTEEETGRVIDACNAYKGG